MSMDETMPRREEKKVKHSSAAWLGAANSMTGLLAAFAEGTAVTVFYQNVMKLDASFIAVAWILFGIWNAINDPIYGWLADRGHHKLGRRIPWIRYGAPIMALCYAISWIPINSLAGNNWFLFFQMIIALFLFDTVYTAIASAIYVMPYEMAVTNKARSPIFLWNIGFSVISYGVPMVANGMLTTLMEENISVFPFVMAGLGLVAGGIVFASTFFYKENGYVKEEKQPKMWEGIKQCVKNKSFLLFEVISFTVIYAMAVLMDGLNPCWEAWSGAEGWLGGSSQIVCLGALGVGLIGSLILFVFKNGKWGARNCTLIMCGAMGVGCIVGSFLGKYMIVLAISFFLIGVGLSGGLYLIPMINGDVIDKDELDNGARREGVYAGVNSLITKPASAIAHAVFTAMNAAYGFSADITKETETGAKVVDYAAQPDSFKDGLFVSWMLIVGVLCLLSFVAMWFFPLHGKGWDEAKAKLAIEHAKKEEEYAQKVLAAQE
ncbi:MAG: MFS transporter [Bacilli bacterium]|nr:MFS transporter [Bacilli bacterium]